MKKTLFFLSFIIPIFIYGQGTGKPNNEYYFSLNYSKLTTGDQNGIHIKNNYNRFITSRLSFGLAIGYLYSAKESSILTLNTPSNYENNIATGDWGFTDEDGIKILNTKTDQQTYIHTDLTLGYQVFNFGSLRLRVNIGGSFAYINNTFITRWELGSFNGEDTGEKNLQLVYPYYSSLLDFGLVAQLDFLYELGDKFILGLSAGGNNYSKSGYRFYDLGIKGGITF